MLLLGWSLQVNFDGVSKAPSTLSFKRILFDSRAPAARTPSEAPYPYRKEKETHKLIFSWLSWLAVLFVGAHGDDGDGVEQR